MKKSNKTDAIIYFLIVFFFGYFGVHKFIDKNNKIGFIYLFTMGLFGLGWLIDTVKAFINIFKTNNSITATVQSSKTTKSFANKQPKIEKKQTKFEKQLSEIPLVKDFVDVSAQTIDKQHVPGFKFKSIRKDTNFIDVFPLVVIDVETTGLDYEENEIIEISAIKYSFGFKPSEAFTTLIKPDEKIPKRITDITNISNEMVAQSPKIYQVMGALNEFVSDCNIAGHNVGFDLKFLYSNGFKISKSSYIFDTLSIARAVVPKDEIENYKLITLCEYYGIDPTNLHRSLSDCLATSKVFKELLYDKTEKLSFA